MIEKIAFRPYRGSDDKIEAEIVVTVAGKKIRRRKRVPDALTTPAAIKAVAKGKALKPSLPAWKWARREAEKLITEPPKKKPKKGPKGLSFGQFCERYLEAYWTSIDAKPMTRLRHETTLRRYHLPKFGKTPMIEITRAKIARYQAELAQTIKGVSGGPAKPASVNTILMVLVTLLKYAAELGYLESVPMVRRLKTPNQKKKAPRYSEEELDQFLLAAENTGDPHVLLAALLGADQGMRRSEIVTLQHEDVDLAKMEITIKRGLSNEVEGETKSGRERTIPMSKRVAQALRRHPRALGLPQVIWHAYKGPPRRYTANGLYRRFGEIQEQLGLRTGVHILRHTAASRLADRGASQAQVAAFLGHSRPSTSDIYVHVSAEGVRGLLDDEPISGEALEKSRN